MKNKFIDAQDTNSMTTKGIVLPLIALGLDLIPLFLAFLVSLRMGLRTFMILCMILSPIAGLIIGIGCLRRGKGQIGIIGKIIAIISIVLPLALVGFIVVFFAGAITGIISIM